MVIQLSLVCDDGKIMMIDDVLVACGLLLALGCSSTIEGEGEMSPVRTYHLTMMLVFYPTPYCKA